MTKAQEIRASHILNLKHKVSTYIFVFWSGVKGDLRKFWRQASRLYMFKLDLHWALQHNMRTGMNMGIFACEKSNMWCDWL